MGRTTGIGWADATWNPWVGCLKVSPGCKQCYMYRGQRRYGDDPRVVRRTSLRTFCAPLTWKDPKRVFVCSWSDFFIEEADDWRDEAWDVMRRTPRLTYQILTKRPQNILDCLPSDWGRGWPNVWLGVSVEDQKRANERIPILCGIPARVRFVSYEPALGPLRLGAIAPDEMSRAICQTRQAARIDWLISGGESGPYARPADPQWFRNIRDECADAGIAYFHKQNGGMMYVDGVAGGCMLDERVYHAFPEGG